MAIKPEKPNDQQLFWGMPILLKKRISLPECGRGDFLLHKENTVKRAF